MTRSRTPSLSRPVAVSLLAVAIAAAAAQAQVTIDSQPKVVKGTAPVVVVTVSNTSRANQPPATGDVLKANHAISDAEGDVVQGVTYRWLRGDVEVGNEETYTATTDDTDQELRVEVTASTDDAATNPSSGMGMATVGIANAAPVATNLRIDGTRAVGQTLTARFDYVDVENDEPGDHLYNWCRRGYACNISNSATYTLGNSDYDREIHFEVIPVAQTGTPKGEVARSALGLALIPGRPPVVSNLRITGDYYVGSTITAEYDYSDPDGNPESGSVIEWCWRGVECGIAYGRTMTSTSPDHGKELSVQVTPKTTSGHGPNTGAMVTAHAGRALNARHASDESKGFWGNNYKHEYDFILGNGTVKPGAKLRVYLRDFGEQYGWAHYSPHGCHFSSMEIWIKKPSDSGYTKVKSSSTSYGPCGANGWYEVDLSAFVGAQTSGKWEVDLYWHGEFIAGSLNTRVTMDHLEFFY